MRNRRRGFVVLLTLAGMLGIAAAAQGAEADVPTWDQTFNGHEMWIAGVDSAIALSATAGKPLLVDFYGRH